MFNLKKSGVFTKRRIAPHLASNSGKSDSDRPREDVQKCGYGKYEYLRGATIHGNAAKPAKPHKGVINLGGNPCNCAPDSDAEFERRLKRYERERREAAEAASAANTQDGFAAEAVEDGAA